MPAVLGVYPADEPWGSLENVPTGRDVMIVFNEQVRMGSLAPQA